MNPTTDETFPITETISIKEAGHNEAWLQDQICDNPSILPLINDSVNLEFVSREKILSKGGRLDILLQDSEDTMYEVEIMLGKSDEKHIIHTIEYWENQKRIYQKTNHVAVLVAESFDKRFFNIIYLFSQSIPLIAVQVNMVQVNGVKALHFSKILDIYEEPEQPEDEDNTKEVPEAYWKKDAPWTVEVSNSLLNIMNSVIPNSKLQYKQARIIIKVDGKKRIQINKRANPQSRIIIKFPEKSLPDAVAILSRTNIDSDTDKWNQVRFQLNTTSLTKNESTIIDLFRLLKSSLEE